MIGLMFSLAVLAAFALGGGGIYLIVSRRERKKGLLMLAAAAVLLGNVAILTAPLPR
jgi:hypothetical protein